MEGGDRQHRRHLELAMGEPGEVDYPVLHPFVVGWGTQEPAKCRPLTSSPARHAGPLAS